MSTLFLARLQDLESTIWKFATRYEIPGVVLAEDLYQEGLIELDSSCKLYPDFEPKLFKQYYTVRLRSRLTNVVRYNTSSCRDWRKTIWIGSLEQDISESNIRSIRVLKEIGIGKHLVDHLVDALQDLNTPETEFTHQRKLVEAKQFIAEVSVGLDEEARKVFFYILLGEIPDAIKHQFQRVPGRISVATLCKIFDCTPRHIRTVLQHIRKQAKRIIRRHQLLDTSLLWSAA